MSNIKHKQSYKKMALNLHRQTAVKNEGFAMHLFVDVSGCEKIKEAR